MRPPTLHPSDFQGKGPRAEAGLGRGRGLGEERDEAWARTVSARQRGRELTLWFLWTRESELLPLVRVSYKMWDTRLNVRFRCAVNIFNVGTKYCGRRIYSKNVFVVYLKFTLRRASCLYCLLNLASLPLVAHLFSEWKIQHRRALEKQTEIGGRGGVVCDDSLYCLRLCLTSVSFDFSITEQKWRQANTCL